MKCNAQLPHHTKGSSLKSISSLRTLFYRQFPGLQAVVTVFLNVIFGFNGSLLYQIKASSQTD